MNGRIFRAAGSRATLVHGILIVGTCVLLGLFIPPSAVVSATGSSSFGSSGLASYALTAPSVFAYESLVVSGSSATSTAFSSQAGDAIIVFVSVYGTTTASVSDSSHDTFSALASNGPASTKAHNSLALFAAFNVAAGTSKTLTVSLSGPAPDSAAADIVDVTGVASAPLDHLGTPSNFSSATLLNQSSALVPATASDLVLAGVSAMHTHNWKATGGDTLLSDSHQPSSGASITAADFSSGAATTGNVYVNASNPSDSTYWISQGLSLRPPTPTSYPVTFSGTGLPVRHTWFVSLGAEFNSTKTPKIGFSEPNGTYRFTIGSISGLVAAPSSGTISVAGAAITTSITFTADTTNWTTYLGGVARNAATTGETTISPANAPNLTLLWTGYTGHVQTEPAVLNGVVYAGGINGYEYAVNSSTGLIIWKTYIGEVTQPNCDPHPTGITSSATVSGGMVYVGGGNITGNLTNGIAGWYALNATTGAIAWNIPIGNAGLGYYNWASPLLADGNAYIGVASRCDQPLVWGGLLQVSLTTHAVIGFFNTTVGGGNTRGSSIWGSPSFDQKNNTIFVTTGNPLKIHVTNYSESVVAINATTLAVVGSWQIPAVQVANVTDADFGTTPDYFHLANGTPLVSAVNKDGQLYVLNPTKLSAGPVWQTWITNSENPPTVDPAGFGGGLLYQGGGNTSLSGVTAAGSIRAYYPGNGTLKWHHAVGGDVFGAPIYSNGVLVVGGGVDLDVFNASSGKLLWNWTCSSGFDSAPSIAEGRIYVGCHNLYAFGLTGKLAAGTPIAGPTGLIGSTEPRSSPSGNGVDGLEVTNSALPERLLATATRQAP
jgi:outer membrane protein assembly factor BamB